MCLKTLMHLMDLDLISTTDFQKQLTKFAKKILTTALLDKLDPMLSGRRLPAYWLTPALGRCYTGSPEICITNTDLHILITNTDAHI